MDPRESRKLTNRVKLKGEREELLFLLLFLFVLFCFFSFLSFFALAIIQSRFSGRVRRTKKSFDRFCSVFFFYYYYLFLLIFFFFFKLRKMTIDGWVDQFRKKEGGNGWWYILVGPFFLFFSRSNQNEITLRPASRPRRENKIVRQTTPKKRKEKKN